MGSHEQLTDQLSSRFETSQGLDGRCRWFNQRIAKVPASSLLCQHQSLKEPLPAVRPVANRPPLPCHVHRQGSGPHHLAHRIARHMQLTNDLLDRLAGHEKLAPDPRNRIHALHPRHPSSLRDGQSAQTKHWGSISDADYPALGVKFARRKTTVA